MAAEGGGDPGDGDDGVLLVRVHVPELNVQKCLQFPRDQRIWDVKQQCLAALPKVASWYRELKESFNYGLFCPPENGRAGKFLDEERRLGDYPFNGPVGYLELKYKRRVYKMVSLDEKQLKNLHSRTNLRRFLDYVQNGHVDKITKMCDKGLDPNFHCPESGETPLTIATGVKKPSKVIISLVNGGALLDYRSKDGSTAMHRSVERRSLEALRTLLELGASPNYRDGRGLTPLYLAVASQAEAEFAETLLHDHATTGAKDAQGWQEVHQACKMGLLPQLEHLLFYGADMNSRNASGNTPLHVCAVNGQDSCARLLLFRGADKHALNFANQTPAQVAVIATNMDLANLIQNYSADDIVPFRGPPSYNPRRRSALGWVGRPPPPAPAAAGRALPPSPCPSDRSSTAPFSSASSSLSDGGSSVAANRGAEAQLDNASIVTEKSLGEASDVVSDSSGVGTAASSDTNTNCGVNPSSMTPPAVSMPTGSTAVCVESYTAEEEGHISIREGELIEVTGATDDGFLEGSIRTGGTPRSGLFPASHVQEVRLRHRGLLSQNSAAGAHTAGRVVGRRESLQRQPPGQQHFATAPRTVKKGQPNPTQQGARVVIVHKGRRGFGFVLKGARRPLDEGEGVAPAPPPHWPSLQYVDNVEPGGAAAVAGLRRGDFLLRVAQEDVTAATHDRVVELIVAAGKLLVMTVISLHDHISTSLPMSRSTILPGNMGEDPNSRQYAATLPRKMSGAAIGRQSQAPAPPRRDPRTTLSVGRARAKSMVAGLGGDGNRDDVDELAKSSSAESIHQLTSGTTTATSTPVPPRTASIKQRPMSARLSQLELEELFRRDRELAGEPAATRIFTSPSKGRAYASVSEMKRSKSKSAKQRFQDLFAGRELSRTFHSTPDLTQEPTMAYNQTLPSKSHRSQEDLAALVSRTSPPNHPPPPPPQFQLIKLGAQKNALGEYDTLNREEGIASSFKPTTSAKLYASPDNSKELYQRKNTLQHLSRPHLRKSQSMKGGGNGHTNPYAQPIRASRSNSSAGGKERRKKLVQSKSASSVSTLGQVPPIPEPDYSCTDSEGECDNERKDVSSLAARLSTVQLQPVENSGNSNTSGSSTGSGAASSTGSAPAPNITVEDIQRGRSLLRSSKSYPDDFLKDGGRLAEDGDNSSSGVSSDQEIGAPSGPAEYADRLAHHEHGSMTLPSQKDKQRPQIGLTRHRHAVSLARLPPPLEAETDEEFCLPPPPEFVGGANAPNVAQPGEEVVVAPPPQFSDGRQVSRVRIVGAVPKGGAAVAAAPAAALAKPKPGRLHSQ